MTDSTKPGAGAVVTREMREQVLEMLVAPNAEHKMWAVSGSLPALKIGLSALFDLDEIAELAADFELRGQRSRDAEVERLTRGLTAPSYFASNHEAGDGQTMCSLCDEEVEEEHALTVCIANLRSERDALHAEVGRLSFPDVTDEQLAEDIEVIENVIISSRCLEQERLERFRRITAALARGGK